MSFYKFRVSILSSNQHCRRAGPFPVILFQRASSGQFLKSKDLTILQSSKKQLRIKVCFKTQASSLASGAEPSGAVQPRSPRKTTTGGARTCVPTRSRKPGPSQQTGDCHQRRETSSDEPDAEPPPRPPPPPLLHYGGDCMQVGLIGSNNEPIRRLRGR